MIKNIYDITLKLITPSEQGILLDFMTKQDDLLDAVWNFNDKFRTWNKRIIVYMISKKSIHLLLFMENEKQQEHVTTREIRFFTTYLNNRKGWNVYSRNSSKLFEGVNFSKSDLENALRQIDGIEKDSEIYQRQYEEIEFLSKEYKKQNTQTQISTGNYDISDEDVITIIHYLVKTKNKGDNSSQKVETVSQIKELLRKWL